jgi:hypothetical protein
LARSDGFGFAINADIFTNSVYLQPAFRYGSDWGRYPNFVTNPLAETRGSVTGLLTRGSVTGLLAERSSIEAYGRYGLGFHCPRNFA